MAASMIPDWTPHTLAVLAALGTVGAVVIAVLGGLLRRFLEWVGLRRSRPSVSLSFDPQHDLGREAVQLGGEGPLYPALYARIRVENEPGRRAATGVEVIPSEIVPLDPSPNIDAKDWRRDTIRSFGPLGWTHTDPPALTLGPGAVRTVDLGLTVDAPGETTFRLGLKVQPASGLQNLPPGRYEITLTVAAANVDAQRWKLMLDYDGMWLSSERAGDHLKVTELHRI